MSPSIRVILSLTLLSVLAVPSTSAQVDLLFDSYIAFKDSLTTLTQIADATERDEKLSALWDSLRAHQQIPFKHGASVAFLYRGSGTRIQVAGDFNGWNPNAGTASLMAPSNVWIREETFPEDARLDYKIVRNGNDWILDPANPLRQRGGFGDNSELRMPAYVPSPWVERRAGTLQGSYSLVNTIASASLGYTVNYRVYLPAGYEGERLSDLPVIYVTDGHEYADDLIGSMRIVLDNLIADGEIVPVIAVFIDPRVGGNNLRGSQYVENPQFAAFVADELVPVIDATYRTDPRRYARAILGTSLGGLNSAYFAAERTDTFYLIGIQSPAFHAGNDIYDLYRDEPVRDVRIHMSWGTIFDVGDAGEVMAGILSEKGYQFETVILNEGHSWGSWRATLDDMLVYFWGAQSNVSIEETPSTFDVSLGQNYPNPFSENTTIPISLPSAANIHLSIYDLLGRKVATLAEGMRPPGTYRLPWRGAFMPSGVYVARLEVEGRRVQTRMLILTR